MISRTLFVTAAISYMVFLALDWMRPGFVAYVFSPHFILLVAIISAVVWARQPVKNQHESWSVRLVCVALGALLAGFFWKEGQALGDLRLLVSLIAFGLPLLVRQGLMEERYE